MNKKAEKVARVERKIIEKMTEIYIYEEMLEIDYGNDGEYKKATEGNNCATGYWRSGDWHFNWS